MPDQSATILNDIIRITYADIDIGILWYLHIHQFVAHGIHQGIEVVRTCHQPTLLIPFNGCQIVGWQNGIMSVPGGILLRIGVPHLQTTA